jgi:hypothetical protein
MSLNWTQSLNWTHHIAQQLQQHRGAAPRAASIKRLSQRDNAVQKGEAPPATHPSENVN